MLPSLDLAIDLNTDDGFTIVRDKKKRRGNSISVPKKFHPNTSNNQHVKLLTNLALTNVNTISQNADINCKPQTSESSSKFPHKIFQEIGEDYEFEIIPAAPVPPKSNNGQCMDVDSLVEIEDNVNTNSHAARRRGRPPGSKNKPSVPKPAESSNSFLALADQEGNACSTSNILSQ